MHLLHVLLGLLFTLCTCSSAATNTISPGRVLAGNDRLVSGNAKFALGFFQFRSKSANTTYLGIWFNRVPELTPVWSANGDSPVIEPTSPELTISGDGNLVILDQATKFIIWSTHANLTTNDTVAVLLDSGNLVLHSSQNLSNILWQSFDHPTDTILPGAKIGRNKITGQNIRYVSRKNKIDQSAGVYSMELDFTGVGRLLWNSSIPYWSTGEWNGKFFDSIPEMSGSSVINYTLINNSEEVYFTYTLSDEKMLVRSVLDIFGQRKMFLWLEKSKDWSTFYARPKAQCDVYAICGPSTICNDNATPLCNCMKGFSIKSLKDWELGDRTGGCMRNTPLICGSSKKETDFTDRFFPMADIRLPHNAQNIESAITEEECSQICLSNCSCTAYSYSNGRCSIWHGDLLDVKQQHAGDVTSTNRYTIHLRLPAKEMQSWKTSKNGTIIGVAIGVSIVLLGFFLLVVWRSKERWSNRGLDNIHSGSGIIAFTHIDLQRATKNFSEKIGRGGFGSVFKGVIGDSTMVAVKRLDGARQGDKQFRAEVSSVGIIQHINLVKLVGFCCEGDRRILVYEHMPNRSLDSHLFQCSGLVLNWVVRYQIALGVARGLEYLHNSCRDCIIHCDIKPENILLDEFFVPKIADFGMAKILGRDFTRVVTTIRGTIGYLAPEWISGAPVTSKVDVYSYGMVLLEIISGKRNWSKEFSNDSDSDCESYFPVKVAHNLLKGVAESLVDIKLQDDVNLEEVERVCKCACWCIQDNELYRPTMSEVVLYLEGLVEFEIPPVPRILHAIAGDLHTM